MTEARWLNPPREHRIERHVSPDRMVRALDDLSVAGWEIVQMTARDTELVVLLVRDRD